MKAHTFYDNTFVWNSDPAINFSSIKEKTFIINAPGGVGIDTNDPQVALDVSGAIRTRPLPDTIPC